MEPPASLKERVLAAVAAEPRPRESGAAAEPLRTPVAARTSDALPGVPVMAPRSMEPAPVTARVATRRANPLRWLVGIAAVLAIVGLVAWNVLLQTQLGSVNAQDRAIASVLDVAARPGSATAILSGEGGQPPHGIAAIPDGSVVLAMRELQTT